MRRLALVIPINSKGQVLLQHRDCNAPIEPNYWAFFGGHIEEGETSEQAARREFKEELQIPINNLFLYKHAIFEGEEWGTVERYFYLTNLEFSRGFLKELQLEGDDLGWFNGNELVNLKISENDKKVLDKLTMAGIIRD